MNRLQTTTSASACLAAALLCWITAGCAPATKPEAPAKPAAAADDHDHGGHDHGDHAHPETLAEGIAELEKAAADVAAKLAEGAEDAADDAIHLAGHVVEDVKALLAKQEGLADEAKQAGEKALAELFEAFDRLRREIAIILVDHHLDLALALSDRTVALERGSVQWTGESRLLREDQDLRRKVLWL